MSGSKANASPMNLPWIFWQAKMQENIVVNFLKGKGCRNKLYIIKTFIFAKRHLPKHSFLLPRLPLCNVDYKQGESKQCCVTSSSLG